jgi:hypothetical protein
MLTAVAEKRIDQQGGEGDEGDTHIELRSVENRSSNLFGAAQGGRHDNRLDPSLLKAPKALMKGAYRCFFDDERGISCPPMRRPIGCIIAISRRSGRSLSESTGGCSVTSGHPELLGQRTRRRSTTEDH